MKQGVSRYLTNLDNKAGGAGHKTSEVSRHII